MSSLCQDERLYFYVSNQLTLPFSPLVNRKKTARRQNPPASGLQYSRLRDIDLPARTRELDHNGVAIPWAVPNPWDTDAAPDDPAAAGLIPLDKISDPAMKLREREHGSTDIYAAKLKEIRAELNTCAENHLVAATIGVMKSGRKLDVDVLTWMTWEIIKYRRRFPRGDTKHLQTAYSGWKQTMYQRLYAFFPDLSPDNRVFSSESAERKWKEVRRCWHESLRVNSPFDFQTLDAVFRSRLQIYDAKQEEGPGVSRNAKLEALLAGNGRPSNPCEVWAAGATDTEADLIDAKLKELVEEWKESHPDGKFEDNRLQLTQRAKRKVWEELSANDPTFVEKWEAEAARTTPVTPEEKYT